MILTPYSSPGPGLGHGTKGWVQVRVRVPRSGVQVLSFWPGLGPGLKVRVQVPRFGSRSGSRFGSRSRGSVPVPGPGSEVRVQVQCSVPGSVPGPEVQDPSSGSRFGSRYHGLGSGSGPGAEDGVQVPRVGSRSGSRSQGLGPGSGPGFKVGPGSGPGTEVGSRSEVRIQFRVQGLDHQVWVKVPRFGSRCQGLRLGRVEVPGSRVQVPRFESRFG